VTQAPAGQATVRRHNLALVLGCVASGEPVSRAGVSALTGLTRSTVSSLVEELLGNQLLTELEVARGGTGRPAAPLQLNRNGPAGLGLEIGIDHVGACVVDLTGTVRAWREVPTTHRDADPAVGLGAAARLGTDAAAEAGLPIAGTCVAVPGLVDPDGVVRYAPNLPRWTGVDVTAQLPGVVTVANEADLAAMAELWFGAEVADAIHVSADVGVGAGVVIGGELFRGPGGRAGEIGHVVVAPDGPACRCGGRGCLEAVAGLEPLLDVAGVRDAAALVASPGPAVAVAARALAVALTGAVNVLDVRHVVLGGVYARIGEPLRAAVAAELRHLDPPVEVALAASGTGGALRGAATSVVHDLIRTPSAAP
jgi:predicted NBD/HSP70 family sugar kinase